MFFRNGNPPPALRNPSRDQDYSLLWPLLGSVIVVVGCAWLAHSARTSRMLAPYAERRREIAHTVRLAVAGELMASIIHEINQPLAAILSNAEAADMLLQNERPDLGDLRQILIQIRDDNLRIDSIVKKLRGLMAKNELEFTSLHLNSIVDDAVALLRLAVNRAEISLVTELETELPRINGDRTQLQQVLVNVILNAIDAMAATDAGDRETVIRTKLQGRNVECAVLDRGHGFSWRESVRALDRFYTTKPNGLGIGLSITRAIIDRHHGYIRIANREDGGAVVAFSIPAATQPEDTSNA